MTREEAIRCLSVHSSTNGSGLCTDKQHYEAKQVAIKALEQEPCDDAISRDMALEKMADYVASGYADSVEDFEEYSRTICQLPSVKPQEPCEDANANQHNSNALNYVGQHTNALEGDLISRQAALDAFGLSEKTRKYGGDQSGYDTMMLYEIQQTLEDLPSVTPKQRTGHWIFEKGDGKTCVDGYVCSACNKSFHTHVPYFAEYKYCPNCGCRMVEPQESEGEK